MHVVTVLALDGVIPFDLSTATMIFGGVRGISGTGDYDVVVAGQSRRVRSHPFDLHVNAGLDALDQADTIIVPGLHEPLRPVPRRVLTSLTMAYQRGARLCSICTGTFVLAATGLLDGRRATTHWLAADQLAALYPAISVDPDVLFVDEGRIVTSAGASAGLDMCLHLIRRDNGQAAAARAACLAVAPLDRDGGQAQFIRREPPTSRASLASLLEWMQAHCTQPHAVEHLAARAGMSPRTFAAASGADRHDSAPVAARGPGQARAGAARKLRGADPGGRPGCGVRVSDRFSRPLSPRRRPRPLCLSPTLQRRRAGHARRLVRRADPPPPGDLAGNRPRSSFQPLPAALVRR